MPAASRAHHLHRAGVLRLHLKALHSESRPRSPTAQCPTRPSILEAGESAAGPAPPAFIRGSAGRGRRGPASPLVGPGSNPDFGQCGSKSPSVSAHFPICKIIASSQNCCLHYRRHRLSTVLGTKLGWISSTGPSFTHSHKPVSDTRQAAGTGLGARIWGNQTHKL